MKNAQADLNKVIMRESVLDSMCKQAQLIGYYKATSNL